MSSVDVQQTEGGQADTDTRKRKPSYPLSSKAHLPAHRISHDKLTKNNKGVISY